MRIFYLLIMIGVLALSRADELTDAEIQDEMLHEQLSDPHNDEGEETFTVNDEPDDVDKVDEDLRQSRRGLDKVDEDLQTSDAKPGWVRRVVRVGRRVVRRVVRKGRRVVRRVVRTGRRVVRRVVRTGKRLGKRIYRKGKRLVRRLIRLFSNCGMAKYYRRGKHVAAEKSSVSCILETDYRKQARCWAPRIYYAIGEQFRASSVDYFLPHVKMIDRNNRVLQHHCRPNNLRAAKKGFLTTRTPLRSPTSTLPFFRGQNPLQTPIYTFYRTFRQGSNTFKDFFYWAFYPYNQGKRVCLGASIKGRCVGKCRWFGNHVGDWEHVTIRLKNNLPFAMYISAHNFGGKYNYDNYRGTFVRGAPAWNKAQRPRLSGNIALRKPTRQSSIAANGHAARAVDGNTNGYYNHHSCTHTHYAYRSWWRVDLRHQKYVYKVTITNRFDCCWDRLRNFEIRVGNIDSADGANILCAHHPGHFGRTTKSLYCSSPSLGRYLYIRKLITGVLTLCEVKVHALLGGYSPLLTGNIAYRRGTRQISTGWSGHPQRAVDGNRNGNYNSRSCTHTHRHSNPWWRVDLGSKQEVAKVSISNRADCCWGRLRRVEVRVGNHGHSVHGSSVCTFYPHAFGKGETKLLTCSSPVIGRYVYIRILVHEWLTLCEVQVYAYKPGNLALKKPTRQSSTGWHGCSKRAVDGNRNSNYNAGSCTHTQRNYYPWWRVDLGTPQRVFKVSLTNRGDCCWGRLSRVEISVGNTDRSGANPRCYYHGGALGRSQTALFTCYRPLVGRYVYVRRHGWGMLTLCEVQVFGTIGGLEDVKMTGGHPVVFEAKGSHGMWTRQGVHTYMKLFNGEKLQDQASAGVNWDTWRNMKLIRYQKTRPYTGHLTWLNYDGDWGNKERGCINLRIKFNVFKKWKVNKSVKQCTLNGGPSSLNSRPAMKNHFPLN